MWKSQAGTIRKGSSKLCLLYLECARKEGRGNAMGIFEANVGLWQILARQGQISQDKQNDSWRETIRPFAQVSSSTDLFDAGRNSLVKLLRAATGEPISQNKIIELIAGPHKTDSEGQRIHRELADRIRAVLDDQRWF